MVCGRMYYTQHPGRITKNYFCAGSIGAAAGLVYVALKTKDTSRVNTWIAPAAVICSAISCIGIAFHVGVLGWLFGIISVVAGVELLARITIAANPMDTPLIWVEHLMYIRNIMRIIRLRIQQQRTWKDRGY